MGPEPDPCGTPNFKGCFSKVPASTETQCTRSGKGDFHYSRVVWWPRTAIRKFT